VTLRSDTVRYAVESGTSLRIVGRIERRRYLTGFDPNRLPTPDENGQFDIGARCAGTAPRPWELFSNYQGDD
jgi:hypothetical protein